MNQWPALAGGRVYVWEAGPFEGVPEKVMWLGAAVYARECASGEVPSLAYQRAEQEVYRVFFGCA
jgi:hypothetical protein